MQTECFGENFRKSIIEKGPKYLASSTALCVAFNFPSIPSQTAVSDSHKSVLIPFLLFYSVLFLFFSLRFSYLSERG